MRQRRSFVVLVLPLLVGLGLTGCGKKDDASATTTTAKATTTTTIPTIVSDVPEETTTTVASDPESFKAAMAKLRADLATADEFCEIAITGQGTATAGAPTSPDQVKDLFAFYQELFNKLADNLPAALASDADVLRDAAARMVADAESKGNDPDQVVVGEVPPAFAEPDVMAVMNRIGESMGAACSAPPG